MPRCVNRKGSLRLPFIIPNRLRFVLIYTPLLYQYCQNTKTSLKAMQESKGQETPQSNFCVNDIKKLLGMYEFIKQNARSESYPEFAVAAAKMDFGIKLMSGQSPVPNGSSFKQEFDNILKAWYEIVAKYEPLWREKHQIIWNQLVEFEQNAIKQNASK